MDTINHNWLYSKGWTVRQAAKAINRSYSHVAYVLRGERKSKEIEKQLQKLPMQPLRLRSFPETRNRERITH